MKGASGKSSGIGIGIGIGNNINEEMASNKPRNASFFVGDLQSEKEKDDKTHHNANSKTKTNSREQKKRKQFLIEQREIIAFMKDREAELIVLVEGIDVMTR